MIVANIQGSKVGCLITEPLERNDVVVLKEPAEYMQLSMQRMIGVAASYHNRLRKTYKQRNSGRLGMESRFLIIFPSMKRDFKAEYSWRASIELKP